MKRLALALALAALSCSSAAEWVIVNDNDEYTAYADPATISREGNLVQMSDLIDLKSPRSSPYGNQHGSSTAHSHCGLIPAALMTLAHCTNSRLITAANSSGFWLTTSTP